MTLPMTRPWKHPKTGFYWLRKRVPDALRALVGKREEKISLRTRNPEDAKRLLTQTLLEVEARWEKLRKGARPLLATEVQSVANDFRAAYISYFGSRDRTGAGRPPSPWNCKSLEKANPGIWIGTECGDARKDEIVASIVDSYSETEGLVLSEVVRTQLVAAIIAAINNVATALAFRDALPNPFRPSTIVLPSEHRPIQRDVARHPQVVDTKGERFTKVQAALTFDQLVEGWAIEKQPRQKTRYGWGRVLDQFGEFLGHRNADVVTPDDVIAWKSKLLDDGLLTKTIRDSKLAPVRAMFQWAVDNRKLPSNPAERVTINLRTRIADRKRGYTDEEARTVVKAAVKETDPLRHWVPLLCAVTGARVSEVCQLRVEDVVQRDKFWCVHFTAEAGDLKNVNSERTVPLHDMVLNLGFIDFVKSTRSGPLFAGIKPDRFGNRGGNGTKIISRWVRSLGLTDRRLSPSHSWRHRLKTVGRDLDLRQDIVDAITGHQPKSEGDRYGEHTIRSMRRELMKIPSLVK